MSEDSTQPAFDEPGKLMKKVQDLLKNDPRSIPEIYKQSGIPFYWLRKFADGAYQNPSVNRIERLYEFLTGKSLEV